MKTRTKWALGLGVLAFLALMIFVPKLGAAVGAAGLLALTWIARKARAAIDIIKAEIGTVEGQGDSFAPVPGAPGQLDVWASSEDPAAVRRVQLPEGMTSYKVKSVRVIPGGKAVVEVLP